MKEKTTGQTLKLYKSDLPEEQTDLGITGY